MPNPHAMRLPSLPIALPTIFAAAVLALPAAAHAQGRPPAEDIILVGLGVGVTTSYDGADEYRVIPGGTLQGTIEGHDFRLNGPQLFVDAIPNDPDRVLDFEFGPVAGVSFNRTGEVSNPQVAALGELDTAIELGFRAGISLGRIVEQNDRVELTVTTVWDVGGAHGSHVISPGIDYSTLLGRRTYIRAGISVDIVGDSYADYYFGVTPAGSATSGLREWNPDGGIKSIGTNALVTHSLTGARKGWALFGVVGYSRLQGDFAESPLVRDVGSADQFFGSVGVGYTF